MSGRPTSVTIELRMLTARPLLCQGSQTDRRPGQATN
jgi:hypothetical protein